MDKIKVGVIGTGFATAVHVPGFQYIDDTEVVAICSARRERTEEAAEKFGIPNAFTDYREMLKLPNLDVVSIVTPPILHREMALAAIAAGKHVLCEKPLAMNAAEAQEMYERAQDAGVVHMVAHEFRFSPARQYAKELIDGGYIGDLRHVQIGLFMRTGGTGTRPWAWGAEAAQGGSFLGALGSHYIDALRFLFGDIVAVSGFVQSLEPDRAVPGTNEVRKSTADDMFNFTARFKTGGYATMVGTNTFHGGSGAKIEVYGSEGALILDQGHDLNPPTFGKLAGSRMGEGNPKDLPIPDKYFPFEVEGDPRLFQFVVEVRELVRAIREGTQASPSLYDGFRCQQVIDAVRASTKSRQWESIPL